MLRHIINLLDGTISHWDDNRNKIITELWNKCEHFPLKEKIISKQLIIASMNITDYYLGPQKGKFTFNPIKKKDIKTLSYNDFNNITRDLITLLIKIYSINNPELKFEALNSFVHLYKDFIEITDEFNAKNEEDIKSIILKGLEIFAKNSKIIQGEDPILTTTFFGFVNLHYKIMNDKIKLDLNINS
jgi:hypothetical protein